MLIHSIIKITISSIAYVQYVRKCLKWIDFSILTPCVGQPVSSAMPRTTFNYRMTDYTKNIKGETKIWKILALFQKRKAIFTMYIRFQTLRIHGWRDNNEVIGQYSKDTYSQGVVVGVNSDITHHRYQTFAFITTQPYDRVLSNSH